MKLASLLCLSWELWLVILPCTTLATPLSVLVDARSEEPNSLHQREERAFGRAAVSSELHVRRSGAVTLDEWAMKQKRKVEMRYNRKGGYAAKTETKMAKRQQQQQQRGQKGYVELHNLYSDTEYYGEIRLGTPARSYNVILDTGSSDLWLAGPKCSSATGCEATTRRYGVQPSRTMFLHNSTEVGNEHLPILFNVSYGSGEASGALVQDTVSIGGYTIQNQSFASCEHVTPGLLAGNISGILGLGFQSISSADVKPFWQLLAENYNHMSTVYGDKDSSFEMGFAFTRFLHDPDSIDTVMPGGSMSLGSRNGSLFTGDIEWNIVDQKGYWMIQMDDIKLGDAGLGLGSKLVAIDTGTSLIGGPSQAVQALYDQMPGSAPAEDPLYAGYYTFPCSTKTTVSLVFNGTEWPISPYDFNLGRVGDGSRCLGSIFSLADKDDSSSSSSDSSTTQVQASPDWIIGDSFLKNVYSVFRYENPTAVGFARLSEEAEELSEKPVNEGDNAASTMDLSKQAADVSGAARASRMAFGGTGGSLLMAGLLMMYGAARIW